MQRGSETGRRRSTISAGRRRPIRSEWFTTPSTTLASLLTTAPSKRTTVRIPIRPHFGVIGVAPKEADVVDSIPPGYFGGNIDNWRVGKGATMYYPVAVPGALLSVGDSHASQGDSELCGTAIECSLTGTFQLIVHKKATLEGTSLAELSYPLLETQDEWVLHGFSFANYLQELGPTAQQTIYEKSSVDLALKDAFRKMRAFLMTTKGLSEDEAIALISIAVDFV